MIPYLMVWSAMQITAGLSIESSVTWVRDLGSVAGGADSLLRDLFPLALTANVAAMLALERGLPRTGLAVVGEVVLVPVLAGIQVSAGEITRYALGSVLALVLPFIVAWVVQSLQRFPQIQLMQTGQDPNTPVAAINLVVPTLVMAGVGVGVASLFSRVPWHAADQWVIDIVERLPEPAIMVVYVVANSALWSVGVSGYYALLPLLDLIQTTQSGSSLLGAFVFLGGAGATLGLILASILKRDPRRPLAVASLVPAAFNVNEPVLFGFPVVFNPRLLTPFVLAPLANLGLAWLVIGNGWVPIERAGVPFNAPILMNAWLVSDGHPGAIALQIGAVMLSTAIYYPFVGVGRSGQPFVGSESALRQVGEEIDHRIGDPLGTVLQGTWRREDAQRRIEQVTEADLAIEYQPKVSRDSGEVVGVEALLRITSADGSSASPGSLLRDVVRSGLSVDTDLWVLDRVQRQLQIWETLSDAPPIAMNLAVESLRSDRVIDAVVAVAADFPGQLSVEITEESLLVHDDVTKYAISRLSNADVRVFIDDFGTGFSALSYLRRYQVNGIKIDQEFTAGLSSRRGQELFEEMCLLAQRLDLEVVVEGIEEDWQLAHVPSGHGIAVQGWLYAPALDPERVIDFIRNRAMTGS